MMLVALLGVSTPASAKYASYIVDAETGEVMHAVNENTRNYPASLTKMMTLYLLFEALEQKTLEETSTITFSKRAAGQPPSRLGLKAGETLSVRQAILALITKSANDVATAVAEELGGSERKFAQLMTAKARQLGMKRTTFRNASGLPNRGQMSTAKDMATLAQALMSTFPRYYALFATQEFTFRNRRYSNHNDLLSSYNGTDGIKTGYIRAAGFNLVASAKRDGHRLIGVVFGGKTAKQRNRHMKSLLDKSFTKIAQRGDTTPEPAVAVAAVTTEPEPELEPVPVAETVAVAVAETETPASDKPVIEEAAAPAIPGVDPALDLELTATPDASDKSPTTMIRQWAVQVGAFFKRHQAEEVARSAQSKSPERLGQGVIKISSVNTDNQRTLFRSRIVGLTRRDALGACRELEAKRHACMALKLPHAVSVALAE